MLTVVVVVADEGGDGGLELAWEEVVLEEEPVLERLVPALDLALGCGWFGAPRAWPMPLLSSHSARLPATQDEPLSLRSRGL